MDDLETLRRKVREADDAVRQLAEVPKRRAAAFVQKRAAEVEFAKHEPAVRAAQEQAARAAAAARFAFEKAENETRQKYFAVQGLSATRDRVVWACDAELRETAPSVYGSFIDELDKISGKARHSSATNGRALVDAIRAARERTEALQLDPREDDKAVAHVTKLRASIPPLDLG